MILTENQTKIFNEEHSQPRFLYTHNSSQSELKIKPKIGLILSPLPIKNIYKLQRTLLLLGFRKEDSHIQILKSSIILFFPQRKLLNRQHYLNRLRFQFGFQKHLQFLK